MSDSPDDDWTLKQAQSWLRDHVDDGAVCPCCTQMAKVYRRKINSGQAQTLILLWRAGTEWVHLASIDKSREASKLVYWDLLEQESERRDDGGRSGWWRLTDRGRLFVNDQLQVPKFARIYDGRLLNHDLSEFVSITDVLGANFDYDELMRGL